MRGETVASRDHHPSDAARDSTLVHMSVVALVTTLIAYCFVVLSIQSQASGQPWITGDWLINYAGGFVRRGLIGEAVRQLYYAIGIDPVSAVLALKALFYGLASLALIAIASRRRFDVFDFAFLISPPALAFEIYDPVGSGRKEIVLLAAFTVYVALDILVPTDTLPFQRRWQFWFLLSALPVLALVHEGLVFFFPFFFAYNWIKGDSIATDAWAVGLPWAAAAGVFLLSYRFQGDASAALSICSSLTGMSLDKGLCAGAIDALRQYGVRIRSTDVARFMGIALCSFAPLMWYATRTLNVTHRATFFVAVFLAMAATIPLYAVSEDWGRWIHITWMLTFVTVLALKTMPLHLATRNRAFIPLYVMVIVVYVFSWQMPHWIRSRVPIVKWNHYAGTR